MNDNKRKKIINTEELMFNGKLPPQAIDLEEAVVGACMLESGAGHIHKVAQILHPEDFYVDAHKEIYASILRLNAKLFPADILSVTTELRTAGKLELVGGVHYVVQLTNKIASAANIEYHSLIIKEKSILRKMIWETKEMMERLWLDSANPFDISSTYCSKLDVITRRPENTVLSLGTVATKSLEKIKLASLNPDSILGLPSILNVINNMTDGYLAPDFIIVAAGTGEGKSSFILNEAENFALHGYPTALFSLEMNSEQLSWKMFSSSIEESVKDIRRGRIPDNKWTPLYQLVNSYQDVPLYMCDIAGMDIDKLCNMIRDLVRTKDIKAVIIDYLQLIKGPSSAGNREQEISQISKALKRLAMELNIPIIALSQLSRMERGAKRLYRLSDLRESGALEQDADGVIFIWRPSYHGVTEAFDGSGPFGENDAVFAIEKWRLGETGYFVAKWDGTHSKFLNKGGFTPTLPPTEEEPPIWDWANK